jgi:hypothetical protein
MRTTWELRTWDMLPETLLKVPPSMLVLLRVKGIAGVVDGEKERRCGAGASRQRCGASDNTRVSMRRRTNSILYEKGVVP